jgi:hypothetical protein
MQRLIKALRDAHIVAAELLALVLFLILGFQTSCDQWNRSGSHHDHSCPHLKSAPANPRGTGRRKSSCRGVEQSILPSPVVLNLGMREGTACTPNAPHCEAMMAPVKFRARNEAQRARSRVCLLGASESLRLPTRRATTRRSRCARRG